MSVDLDYGVTLTVHRPQETDQMGNRPAGGTTHEVEGCACAPREAVETDNRGTTVITGLTVFAPYDADITATDTVTVPGYTDAEGELLVWQVQGEVGRWSSPFEDWQPGTQLVLQRAGADRG